MFLAASNEVVVQYETGLHARPAALFVKAAVRFVSSIQVENLTKGSQPMNAKSVLRVLSAGIEKNDRILIRAEGEDEKMAVEALSALIMTNFREAE
jgi:phosphotransferase system HPr (HPr) family protein